MNSSKKFTYPFFETLCVINGHIQFPELHQQRYQKTCRGFYGHDPSQDLLHGLTIPLSFQQGHVKLKVWYNQSRREAEFSKYPYHPLHSLQCVEAPLIDYPLKYSNRSALDALIKHKGNCDDVLILQHGAVRDASYANICFWTGQHWVTPKKPLLQGTKREHLLQTGQIHPTEITINDFSAFTHFKLINAMRNFTQDKPQPMHQILLPSAPHK
ncbi:MAG: aminotransferase class IV [Flavobacteriaceae bacterium]